MGMLAQSLYEKTKDRHSIALVQNCYTFSYDRLWASVQQYREHLELSGLGKGDVIALVASNSLDVSIASLAILQLEAILFPISTKKIDVLNDFIDKHIIPKAILVDKILVNREWSCIVRNLYLSIPYECSSKLQLFVRTPLNFIAQNDTSSKTVAWILSSGTTDIPKAVRLSDQGILRNVISNIDALSLSENDSTLMFLPISYSYGLIAQFISHLYVGAKIIFPPYNSLIHNIPKIVEKEHVTTIFTVPLLLRSLIALLSEHPHLKASFSSLRLLTIGGSSIDKHNLQKSLKIFDHAEIAVTYGMSEAGPRVTTNLVRNNPNHLGSVGRPNIGVEISIIDKSGVTLPRETEGEIVVFSPSVMLGYVYNNGHEPFIPEEMVCTGDYGYISQDGYLYVLGRKSDVIYMGRERIYMKLVKETLYTHPDVLHVNIIISPLALAATELTVYVTPKPGKVIDVTDLSAIYKSKFPLLVDKTKFVVTRNPTKFHMK